MLDEKALRRAEFAAESEPVKLADGQSWYLPKPWVSLYPVVKDGRVETLASRTTFGPTFDELMDALDGATDAYGTVEAIFSIAVHLLSRNYSLADADYPTLLRFRPDDDTSMELIRAIADVARGHGKKVSADGTASVS